MKICVIGGGPAGMIASAEIGKSGKEVILFEKNEKTGKKLFITGKGRCNLTNDCDQEEFLAAVHRNPRFMYSAIYSFSTSDTMYYFENLGLQLKVERGNRVFPMSERSSDVLRVMQTNMTKAGVRVNLKSAVDGVRKVGEKFIVTVNGDSHDFDKVVIATGGITYSQTGSTGDGYVFAESMDHTIIEPKGTLLGLKTYEIFDLAGLTLKNVTLNFENKKKLVFSEMGVMLFTHEGISGPLALTASGVIARMDLEGLKCYIDLKPALSYDILDARVLRDFEKHVNKQFKFAIADLLPSKLINEVIRKTGIDPEKRANSITKEERAKLVLALKHFDLTIVGTNPSNEGVVTCGGIKVSEVNPKTMESKICKGLYFCGEVLDVDAKTGGFNLQVAFSTGFACGTSIAELADTSEESAEVENTEETN